MQLGRIISDSRIKTKHPGTRSHQYTDATVSEAITICAEFGLTDALRSQSSAFKDNLSERALQCLSDLKDTVDLGLPEDHTMLETM